MHKFKILSIDQGFCRINYVTKNHDNQKIYYCLTYDFSNNIELCRSTPDLEPYHPVKIKEGKAAELFELPTGKTQLELDCINWIKNN